jgi:3-hydroxy-9,10-secoandrosta-1,3,5(10)-triene-9,17-dione monooxygenase reductase component
MPASTPEFTIDPIEFRNVLGSFPTGVTVVTSQDDAGNLYGVTASSFNSVSLDPPLILWSIGKASSSYSAMINAKYWNVHVLADDQEVISNTFAKSGGEKFAAVEYTDGVQGAPVIAGCAAVMQCQIEHQYAGGDHVILVGRVLEFTDFGKQPLVFSRGRYARLAQG